MIKKESTLCVTKLKVLADGARLTVLELLMKGPMPVGEMRGRLKIEQSLLSHHLRVLRDEGFVTAKKNGKVRVYSLSGQVTDADQKRSLDLGCCRLEFK